MAGEKYETKNVATVKRGRKKNDEFTNYNWIFWRYNRHSTIWLYDECGMWSDTDLVRDNDHLQSNRQSTDYIYVIWLFLWKLWHMAFLMLNKIKWKIKQYNNSNSKWNFKWCLWDSRRTFDAINAFEMHRLNSLRQI